MVIARAGCVNQASAFGGILSVKRQDPGQARGAQHRADPLVWCSGFRKAPDVIARSAFEHDHWLLKDIAVRGPLDLRYRSGP
jgi:hypothetical protein